VPFAGYMTDLLSRHWIAIFGFVMFIVASAIMGTARGLAQAIEPQTLGGAGAAICELTAVGGYADR